MTLKLFPALALAGALLAGGCTNPDGSQNSGGTALLVGGALLRANHGGRTVLGDHGDHRRQEASECRDDRCRDQWQDQRQERRRYREND